MGKLFALAFLASIPAWGAFSFVLNPSSIATPPGGISGISNPTCSNITECILFSGTITPDDTNDVFVSGIDIVFNPLPPATGLVHEPNFFTANVPGAFFVGDSP